MAKRLGHCGFPGMNILTGTISTPDHPVLHVLDGAFATAFGSLIRICLYHLLA